MSIEESLNRVAAALEKLAGPVTFAPAPVAEAPPRAKTKVVAPVVPVLKYEDIRVAILDLGEKKGIDAAIEVLTKFGVKHAKGLLPVQYPEALKAVQEALAA